MLGIRSIFSKHHLLSRPQEQTGNSVGGYFCRDDAKRLGWPTWRTYGLCQRKACPTSRKHSTKQSCTACPSPQEGGISRSLHKGQSLIPLIDQKVHPIRRCTHWRVERFCEANHWEIQSQNLLYNKHFPSMWCFKWLPSFSCDPTCPVSLGCWKNMVLCSNFGNNFHPVWKYVLSESTDLSLCTGVCTPPTQAPATVRSDSLLDFKDAHSLIPEQQVYVFKGWGLQPRGDSHVKFVKGWRSSCTETLSDWKKRRKEKKKKQARMSPCNPELRKNLYKGNLCNVCVSHSNCSAPRCKACCYYMLYWHVYYFWIRKSLLWPASWSCWVLYSSPGHFKSTSWKTVYNSDTRQKKKYSELFSKGRAVLYQILLPTF